MAAARSSYRLPDEPHPGPLRQLVVHPMWPLLAVMFGGVWLSWPWFVFNAWALGSPTRVRETLIVVAGLLGSFLLVGASLLAFTGLSLPEAALKYLFLVVTVWKLGVSYFLAELQGRGFEVYRWYGGVARNGLLVAVVGGFLLGPQVQAALGGGVLSLVFR